MNREDALRRFHVHDGLWDLVVIGGGATGVAIAMDAALRGLAVVLVEQADFGKGTSSRSTKLVHGGVRYLQQGNIALVRDALRERTLLRANAPHLHEPERVQQSKRWAESMRRFQSSRKRTPVPIFEYWVLLKNMPTLHPGPA